MLETCFLLKALRALGICTSRNGSTRRGSLPILYALCSDKVFRVGKTEHLQPPGNKRDCSRCDDRPRDVMIADFFEKRTGTGDLVCVLAVVLWEEALHVLDI